MYNTTLCYQHYSYFTHYYHHSLSNNITKGVRGDSERTNKVQRWADDLEPANSRIMVDKSILLLPHDELPNVKLLSAHAILYLYFAACRLPFVLHGKKGLEGLIIDVLVEGGKGERFYY